MEMILNGDPIDAATARQVGLVSRIVPEADLLPTARQLAERIAGHAPLAVRAVKEVARAALDETLEQSLRFGNAMRWIIGQTEDAHEGGGPLPSDAPPSTTGGLGVRSLNAGASALFQRQPPVAGGGHPVAPLAVSGAVPL